VAEKKAQSPASSLTLRTVHDRMRVILSRDGEDAWLDPTNQDAATLQVMLRPCRADEMEAVQFNPAMNRPTFEGPECLEPECFEPPPVEAAV
jgi:putative SOS response-associated peptidase YedK